ncbi:MAG TPA: glycerol-3-phosphate 1-O-acyltransferase PlsY [Terriglobia bacterium]|nr:glycerol-3-phosphate 1-O-acyltransferase PlsY [Terriglobia bacterium]
MTGPLTTLTAYLLGSIPFGYLIVWWKKGIDVRETGSRSTGATNVMRNLGLAGFLATFILDFGKGAAAVMLASRLTAGDPRWIAAAAVAAVAGHIAPVWLRFRGGKGVATGVGVFIALAPVPMGLALVIFSVLLAVWRYISLGSIVATAAFPALVYLVNHPPRPILLGAAGAAALIIAKHHANIRRLLTGTEGKVGKKTAGRSQ